MKRLFYPSLEHFQILLLVLIAAMEMARDWLAHVYPHRLFALLASQTWVQVFVCLSAPIDVGIALKVWSTLRLEMKLEEQKRLLLEAGSTRCNARSIPTSCSTPSTPLPRSRA